MNMMTSLVVDDEELARDLLENYISKVPNIELAGKCRDPLEAMAFLHTKSVDLMFLDIQMPELTGLEFLKTLKIKPLVILTTAYPDYALESYQHDVVDYLLKPFSFSRFLQAVNKAAELYRIRSSPTPVVNEDSEIQKEYILVKSEHKVHRIRLDDILYIQSMREYVAFYTPAGRILSLNSLKSLERELPGGKFLRIHKSYIVHKARVSTLEGNMVVLGKEKLPVGSSFREEVLKELFPS